MPTSSTKHTRPAPAMAQLEDSRSRVRLIADLALDKKAEDLAVLEVAALTSVADYFLICSAQSTQQVRAIADNIHEGMVKQQKVRPLGMEGQSAAHWVLLDYGDVVVHVFERETREHYGLEALWLDAPRLAIQHEGTHPLGGQDKGALRS